jgi:ankyrin repeat protein
MKTIQAILVTIWGALVLIPSFGQEAHLRTLAATGTVQEIREALRYSSEVNKRDASGVSTLMLAAGSNHDVGVIAVLISAGADINLRNRSGESALFYAAQSNPNPEMISALLKAGAALDDRDALGRTPLMAAAWGNSNPAVITLLLTAGADAKAKSGAGKTALDYAQDNPSMSAGSEGYQALQEAMR